VYHLNPQRLTTLVQCKLLHERKGHSAPNTIILTSFCKQSCYYSCSHALIAICTAVCKGRIKTKIATQNV